MSIFKSESGPAAYEVKTRRHRPGKVALALGGSTLALALAAAGCGSPAKGSAQNAPHPAASSQGPEVYTPNGDLPENTPEESPAPSPSEAYTQATLQCTGYRVTALVKTSEPEVDYNFMPVYTAELQENGLPANPDPNAILLAVRTDPSDPKSSQTWTANSMPGVLKVPLGKSVQTRLTLYNFSDQLDTPSSFELTNHIQDNDTVATSHEVPCLPDDGFIDIAADGTVRDSWGQTLYPENVVAPN